MEHSFKNNDSIIVVDFCIILHACSKSKLTFVKIFSIDLVGLDAHIFYFLTNAKSYNISIFCNDCYNH